MVKTTSRVEGHPPTENSGPDYRVGDARPGDQLGRFAPLTDRGGAESQVHPQRSDNRRTLARLTMLAVLAPAVLAWCAVLITHTTISQPLVPPAACTSEPRLPSPSPQAPPSAPPDSSMNHAKPFTQPSIAR